MKQRSEDTAWELLGALLERNFKIRGSDKRPVGECMARNVSESSLGVNMIRRMQEKPDDSFEQ